MIPANLRSILGLATVATVFMTSQTIQKSFLSDTIKQKANFAEQVEFLHGVSDSLKEYVEYISNP